MPEIRLTREHDGSALVLDCCDDRYHVERVKVRGQVRICILDSQENRGIFIRETQAEIDAIMAIAHPELSAEFQG